jgi:phosphoribosylanthranilate isomerase
MSGFVKICGLTDETAVAAALAAGADAIGFVFAASPRQVTPARAAELARPARGRALCVAVTLHPAQGDIDAILAGFAPDVLQTDADDFATLSLPASLARLPVLRSGAPGFSPARVLFEGPRSGTGRVADWDAARSLAAQCELILAGGLGPDNVAAAIARVQPFGVDVSSGVESAPGHKDPQRIATFITSARNAFAAQLPVRPSERALT